MQPFSASYIYKFTFLVCLGCSLMISFAAVSLRAPQERNKKLDRQRSVLQAAWLIKPGEKVSAARVQELYTKYIEPRIVDLATGEYVDMPVDSFEPEKVEKKPAPENPAQVKEIPKYAEVFLVKDDAGKVSMVVLPIVGKGLWSTMRGFFALDADGSTIRGLTYYEQGETPGLGGEVENPLWKSLWPGRRAFDEQGNVKIEVIKGHAGPVDSDPYHVDGLSGATITSRGVTSMLHFWLGENGFKPFLEKFKATSKTGRA